MKKDVIKKLIDLPADAVKNLKRQQVEKEFPSVKNYIEEILIKQSKRKSRYISSSSCKVT